MAAYLNDRVYDNGLTVLDTEASHLYINSTQATTYTEAITTYALGVKATPTVSAPAAKAGGGREVTVSAITDGTVSANGTAGFFSLVDSTNSRLLAAGPLSATQAVTSGNTFTLTSFKIGIPSPA